MRKRTRLLASVICLSMTLSLFGCNGKSETEKSKHETSEEVLTEDTVMTDVPVETFAIDPSSSELLKSIERIETYLGSTAEGAADEFINDFEIMSYTLNKGVSENHLTFFGEAIEIDSIKFKSVHFWKTDGRVNQIDLSVTEAYEAAQTLEGTSDMDLPVKSIFYSVYGLIEGKYGKAVDHYGPQWMEGTSGDRVTWNDGEYSIRLGYVEDSTGIKGNNLFRIEIGFSEFDPSSPADPEPYEDTGTSVEDAVKFMQSCIGKDPSEAKEMVEKFFDTNCGRDQADDDLEYETHTHNGRYLIAGTEFYLVSFLTSKTTGKVILVKFWGSSGGNQAVKSGFDHFTKELTALYGQPAASNSIETFESKKFTIDQGMDCIVDAMYSDNSSYRDLRFVVEQS